MARTSRRFRRLAERRRRGRGRVPRGRVLSALTTSTLALPGLAAQASELGELGFSADYKFARYMEDDLASSRVDVANETSRYEIDVHQIQLGGPITDRIRLDLDFAHEVMSGATPWYVIPNPDGGDPLQVMTGATVDEKRTDGLLKGTMLFDRGTGSVSAGVSKENDYLSINGGVGAERFFNEKNTTLAGGLGFSYDMIEPTDAAKHLRDPEEDKQSGSIFGSFSQVLGRNAAVQSTLQYQFATGFLSDPYKRALVEGVPLPDSRPDLRHQFSWLTRYRQHLNFIRGTLHADYRFYLDDWGIYAHTFEAAWYQMLWQSFRLIPSVRYYSQAQADFYAPYFLGSPGSDYSSDYRLSPYGALSWRVKAETRFQLYNLDLLANVAYERYMSGANLAIQDVSVPNPGLVDFQMFSVGLSTRF
jgi:hypothetical protein